MNDPKNLIIYHGNCADGFMSATIARRALIERTGDEPEVHAGVYQNPPPDVAGKNVLIVDFSYKRPVMEKILAEAVTVVILDHHKTAIEDLKGLKFFDSVFNIEKSGAMLTWEYFHMDEPPLVVQHIQDRDLWRFQLPGTREIQAALFSYPYEFDLWEVFLSYGPDAISRLRTAGEAIERKHFKDIRELLKVCRKRLTICGHELLAANLPYTLSSDAGHIMVEEEGEPFGCCFYFKENSIVFSLRSTDKAVDVSEVAKTFGGGGHRNAAGFEIPDWGALKATVR